MAVNDKIADSVREEKSGYEMLDQILDKVNEVAESSSTYSSSVSNMSITNINFGLSESRGVYTLGITVSIYDSVRDNTQTKYVGLRIT